MLDDSVQKFQGVSGAVCMVRKVINAHGEFVIGLKRTSEPRELFSPSNGPPHTHTFAGQSRAHRPPIAV
jgi:hypothetical protein